MLYILLTQRDPRSFADDTPRIAASGWFRCREEADEFMRREILNRLNPGDLASIVEFPTDGKVDTEALWKADEARKAAAQERAEREQYERWRRKYGPT